MDIASIKDVACLALIFGVANLFFIGLLSCDVERLRKSGYQPKSDHPKPTKTPNIGSSAVIPK